MTDTALSTAAAVESLWGGVRIVVIGLETTHSPTDRHDRVLSFAAVTCRAGTVRGKWQTLINPGVPIARETRAVHGITDAYLDGEPMFADVADQFLPLFSPADGETLVVAGHNVGYDISVLRGELSLVGRELPDVPVLDTMWKLQALADVHPDGNSLAALLATLELTNARPYDALADATACAEALVELLRGRFGFRNGALAWTAGCRHPDLVDHHVHAVASGGRPSDLHAALKVCDAALAARGGPTHDGWNRLETHRNLLDGQAQRLRFRHSGTYDADGNPVPTRWHTPTRPRRPRPARFLRT